MRLALQNNAPESVLITVVDLARDKVPSAVKQRFAVLPGVEVASASGYRADAQGFTPEKLRELLAGTGLRCDGPVQREFVPGPVESVPTPFSLHLDALRRSDRVPQDVFRRVTERLEAISELAAFDQSLLHYPGGARDEVELVFETDGFLARYRIDPERRRVILVSLAKA